MLSLMVLKYFKFDFLLHLLVICRPGTSTDEKSQKTYTLK
jgi:hypothetical protein